MKKKMKEKFPKIHGKMKSTFLPFFRMLRIKYYSLISEKSYEYHLGRIYKKRTGKVIDWNNLQTYNEKMQWAKLYDKDPLKTELTDKILVRKWIANTIGERYLVPLLGEWNNYTEINFKELPKQFVLKTNHAARINLVVKNKNNLDHVKQRVFFDKALKKNFDFSNAFEMHYKNIKPKLYAEKLLEDSNGQLLDYKFLCFGGSVYYLCLFRRFRPPISSDEVIEYPIEAS